MVLPSKPPKHLNICEFYIDLQKKHSQEFPNEKIAVILQVGDFYEFYGANTETRKESILNEVCEVLSIQKSFKNCKEEKYEFAGFNIRSKDKFIQLLLDNNYTVPVYNEDGCNPNGSKTRNLKEILTPSLNINYYNKVDNNFLMTIFLDGSDEYLFIGVSYIDITTGENYNQECFSLNNDYNYSLDELYRIIHTIIPCQLLIYYKNFKYDNDFLIKYLELEFTHYTFHNDWDITYENPEYQKQFLEKKFLNKTMMSIWKYLDLESKNFAVKSYIFMLQYIYLHNETILDKINLPKFIDPKNHMILTNNSHIQLNLIRDLNFKKSKNDSLLSIITNTCTPMGKRLIRDHLLNPIMDIDELNHRYNTIERLLPHYNLIQKDLVNISDIERLHRRIYLKEIFPNNFLSLDIAYKSILNIHEFLKNNKLIDITINNEQKQELENFINQYNHYFNLEIIHKFNTMDIGDKTYFNKGINLQIDETITKIENIDLFFKDICENMSKVTGDIEKTVFKYQYLNKEGFSIKCSKSKSKLLQENIKNKNLKNLENYILADKLEFKTQSNDSKINSKEFQKKSKEYELLQDKLKKTQNQLFYNLLGIFYEEHSKLLEILVTIISQIDVYASNAKTAKDNIYYKPTIKSADKGYLTCKNLRHPIIEKINDNVYTPNNIEIGKNMNGMLLYGVNAVGKSSFMKSVGILTIMAQAGMYVPAEQLEYSPYKYLFTRILSNDNIYKGQSSFAVECSELDSILRRSDQNTLILGDELCKGTENISAYSIVSAGIIKLAERKSDFIFATHLHDLSKNERLKKLNNVSCYHLQVEYNPESKKITYNRKLKEGPGMNTYGLEVAKAMIQDTEFIELASIIRKEYINENLDFVNTKTSIYNKNVFMDICSLCNEKSTETHHIEAQKLADLNGNLGHFNKNKKGNLMPLCSKCHLKITNEESKSTIIETTQGNEILTTSLKNIKGKKKFNDNQLNIIKSDEIRNFSNKKQLPTYLKERYSINISIGTIRKIWNEQY